ncbi:hypothetical protein OJAV_G00079130 [Oryzias javanicus]|uniref:Centromere protein X n=1 Tax=Oryzias javanicus TaxID=123683 RepID=A0A437D401_ORYJA|nr:hypothetical protein OJAV_G00079130 [Oryzias javanicus]
MEVEKEKFVSKKEMLWCVPKSYKKFLSQHYDLCHGLFVTGLNSYMNDGYIKAYFKQWGNVISCKVKKIQHCGKNSAVACVKFSAEYEADLANWSGPHIIGGLEVEIRQFVCPKTEEDIDDEIAAASEKPRPQSAKIHPERKNMADKDEEICFRKETVHKLLSSFFKEEKTKLSSEASLLMAEMLKVFVKEAAIRSQKQAESEDCDQVDIEHFEKILPQLLLDF